MKAANSQPIQNRNVLVIGKNSYVGEFLCQHFSGRGAAVVAVGSSECNFLDASSVHELFKSFGGKPFTIIFLAVVNKDVDNSYSAFLKNVQMAWNFVSAARDAHLESVVYFSSVDVYGRAPKLPMSETTALDPDSWYGLSKFSSEWIVREELGSKFPTCLLRIPGIFGSSPKDRSVIGRLIGTIRKEGKAYVHGDGKLLRDYVFAPDLCEVVERLVTRRASGTFNVASGASVSLVQILETIREALAIDFQVVHLPANAERNFDMRYDTSNLSAAIGKFEFSSLGAGISSYLNS
ncbi:MAG TPA: NAD(P)-dependent oxidoreductase [Candidatus Udaeobacter sp.]|nr:NAD(P)-dependent oxidoreductase [Candidatus Udaeobacter sp.]